jgi:serine/threonine protein phosphatase PrpC
VLKEPDPEEQEDLHEQMEQTKDEKIITDSLYNALIGQQFELEQNGEFNVQLSGTTVTSAFFSGNQLYTANVGDSRTILISIDEQNKQQVKIKQVTTDHKPESPNESKRILNEGGRVAQAQDMRGRSSGPQRVWLKNANSPGLAMSRSVGDCIAHSVGCSCEPDLTYTLLTPEDKIVLLASDGVWEFLSN